MKNSTNCNGQFILCMQFLLLRTSKLVSDQFPRLQIFYPNEDHVFSYFIFFSPNGFFFKETEYGERCSVKNSTNYKQQFILTMSFCFLEKAKFSELLFTESRIGRSEYCLLQSETCTINLSFTL